jgi:hypothetical protein
MTLPMQNPLVHWKTHHNKLLIQAFVDAINQRNLKALKIF